MLYLRLDDGINLEQSSKQLQALHLWKVCRRFAPRAPRAVRCNRSSDRSCDCAHTGATPRLMWWTSRSLEGFRKRSKYYKGSLAFNDFLHNGIGTDTIIDDWGVHNFSGDISHRTRISGQLQIRGRARLDHALERERVPCNGHQLRRRYQSRGVGDRELARTGSKLRSTLLRASHQLGQRCQTQQACWQY